MRSLAVVVVIASTSIVEAASPPAGAGEVERFDVPARQSASLAVRAASLWGAAASAARTASGSPRMKVLVALEEVERARDLRAVGLVPDAMVGRVASLRVQARDLERLSSLPGVRGVRLPQIFRPTLNVNALENGAVAARAAGGSGAGVLVAVIDSGVDHTHPDLRDEAGRTRIRYLWDQFDTSWTTSDGVIGLPPPINGEDGQPLGTVYSASQIDAALEGGGAIGSVDLVGHGTLVASAAAGNGRATAEGEPGGVYVGTAPEAELIVVRIGGEDPLDDLLPGDVVAALAWIDERADELDRPVVVNMSFGGHLGPHDGTVLEELAIDEFVSRPGRAVVVSAGNEGGVNIHAAGSTLGSSTVELFQSGESPEILVNCWIPGSDRVDLGFADPTGQGIQDLNLGEDRCASTVRAPNRVTTCVGGIDPFNGDRELLMIVEPVSNLAPISAGRWMFHLRDEGLVSDGRFDCWSVDGQQFVSAVDPGQLVSHPATARGAVAVGALSARNEWPSLAGLQSSGVEVGALASFSSPGPTRDGRRKPEIVTGGDWVLGAFSIGDGTGSGIAGVPSRPDRVASDGVHVAARGTSFSAPQVTGAIALLFELNPGLTSAQVLSALVDTARADAFTGAVPNDSWGFGKLDVEAAVAAVENLPRTPTPTPSPTSTPTATATATSTATATPSSTRTQIVGLPGDANCDGVVTAADLDATFAALFDRGVPCSADCNRDGQVGSGDLVCVGGALGGP